MEEFRKIANYENYSVSNFGKVRNDITNKILKPGINTNGYYKVILCKNGKKKTLTLHRLVAIAFIVNPDDKQCIDHINK